MNKIQTPAEVFNKHAKAYQDRFMDQDLYHDTIDLFCASIRPGQADILELACGPGNITRYLLQQRPDFKILGTDLATNMLDLAAINNPRAVFRQMDCRDLASLEQQYDGVVCGFGLPYLSKEEAVQLIADVAGILRPGGVCYISTMEDEYSKSGLKSSSSGEDWLHIHYHEAGYLTEALIDHGFHIIDLRRKAFPTPDGTTTTDLVLIAGKGPV